MRPDPLMPLPAAGAETAPASCEWPGAVLNCFGERIDLRGRPSPAGAVAGHVREMLSTPSPLSKRPATRREIIRRPFSTGVRAIDGLLTLGAGQRIALLGDADADGTTLLAAIARHSAAHANVILLTGVAPPQLRNLVETGLADEGMRRSLLVVVLTSEPLAHLARAAILASQIAAQLSENGQDVLLAVDSLSRVEAAGFRHASATLLACAGNRGPTAVTAFYVLNNANQQEPLWPRFDALIRVRRDLADRGYAPPIDLLQSWRRGPTLASPEHRQAAELVHLLLAAYDRIEEKLNTAAYRTGLSFEGDLALRTRQAVLRFLQQSPDEPCDLASTLARLTDLRMEIEATGARLGGAFSLGLQPMRLREADPKVRALAS